MYLKTLEKKLSNLKHIRMKVNNDRSVLLISIMKMTKQLRFYINDAVLNKKLITSLNQKYDLNDSVIGSELKFLDGNIHTKKRKVKPFNKERQIWIYLTEEQKYSTDSYSRYEEKILEMTNKIKVDFITIGEQAAEFCKKNKFNILFGFKNEDANLKFASKLVQVIRALYVESNYTKVFFVINTNKSYNEPFQILPIQQFNLTRLANIDESKNVVDLTKFKIYPNIEEFIDAQINIFLENSIHSLIIESSFYNAKTGLVIANKSINKLDDSITKLKKKLRLIKQENQIEEIVMLTRKMSTDLDDIGDSDEQI
ncbi:F0F1 ATP synthase subunit gamma [Mycoplasma enhydrae]|uniref:MSC_0622 family F1-like ATPase gamma subunit n=1 Tax=Mycoplasma enhydrae TaxID=2499220 RepID=UPI00197C49AA|nr:F0F1 ATP synthase subunit gamma [Mycoplasma enhydrae]MBN4089646.1 F0F1 ATP synthase subunit gamma [Mycoplasma enhydrae]MCV3733760.1 F0F1 ATP synthase subunit gamma [Mycoplasma enhydrae]MCV3753515.1 F0F1 ATP synthase subunit gamma [Mycoplasma enhydrae]